MIHEMPLRKNEKLQSMENRYRSGSSRFDVMKPLVGAAIIDMALSKIAEIQSQRFAVLAGTHRSGAILYNNFGSSESVIHKVII